MVNILDMTILAEKRGLERTGVSGKCLSTLYINNYTHLSWECGKCNLIWNARPKDIKQGSWCPRCAGNLKHTIEEMQELARERGIEVTGEPGKCLSKKYFNIDTHLEWQCGRCLNTWKATPNNIKIKGSWCPYCSQSKMESISRMYFERIFDAKFPTLSPKWLINPETANRMHLDGYNKQLKLAFECNGRQHYKFNELFHHNDYNEFLNQKRRDFYKKKLCIENGIILITIPYTLPTERINSHIIKIYENLSGIKI